MPTLTPSIRRLPGSVVASTATHGLVLAGLLAFPSPAPSAALDRQTWVTFEATAPRAPSPTPAPEPPVVTPVRRTKRPAPHAVLLLPQPDSPQPPAPTPPSAIPENPFGSSGIQSVPGGLAVAVPVASGSGPLALHPAAPSTSGPTPSDDRAALRRWMRAVNAVIRERAARSYPRAAERSGQEGTVLVDIVVTERGRIGRVSLRQTSGYASLDRAALAAVHGIGSLPAPPDVYMRRGRPLRMPIAYRVQ